MTKLPLKVKDALLAGLVTALIQIYPLLPTPEQNSWSPADALYNLFLTVPLFWRRRFPLAGLLVILTAATASPMVRTGSIGEAWIPIVVGAYSVALFGEGNRSRIPGLILPSVAVLIREMLFLDRDPGNILILAGLPIAAWFVGDQVRLRARYLVRLQERTGELAAKQEALKREVVATERARIARELQEVITQNVSSMAVQAGAARVNFDENRQGALRALETIETNSRESLVEMRRLLGLLRTDRDADLAVAPQPSLARLHLLADKMRESGASLSIEVEGEVKPLSPGLDFSAYRLVEAAIATADHGSAGASLRVSYGERHLTLEIIVPHTQQMSANGIESTFEQMRERVALFGGDFSIGESRGELVVRARFPLETPRGRIQSPKWGSVRALIGLTSALPSASLCSSRCRCGPQYPRICSDLTALEPCSLSFSPFP